MKRGRFNEEQIIGILKEHEAGISVADLCRKHGVSDASIYKWKEKYGGMDVSEARRLKTLEDENTRLKRLLADAMLDNIALKDLRIVSAPAAAAHRVARLAFSTIPTTNDNPLGLRRPRVPVLEFPGAGLSLVQWLWPLECH